jgi:hypothetical protein
LLKKHLTVSSSDGIPTKYEISKCLENLFEKVDEALYSRPLSISRIEKIIEIDIPKSIRSLNVILAFLKSLRAFL